MGVPGQRNSPAGRAPRPSRDPRANQKARTRAALVAAAAELLRRGGAPPTVAEAAEAARVSRTTAYRYFPSQEVLLLEVAELAPAVAPVEAMLATLPADGAGDLGDAEARLLRLVDSFNPVVFAEEAPMRAALKAYLGTWLDARRAGEAAPVVREGRRVRWLDTALEPVRRELGEQAWRRLRAALALTLGVEPVVVMKDVCRLGDEEALAALRWAAAALLRAGLEEAARTSPAQGSACLRSRSALGPAGA